MGRGVPPRAPVLHSSEEGSSSQPVSKTSLRRAPQPARPPNPIRLSISQPSTPLAPPSPEVGTSSSASPFIPDNPSESFLEALAQDPGEGPSWLFNDNSKGKKKRSSTARQLSALFSESERESGATTGASTSGMDTSDISLEEPGSADSSLEVIFLVFRVTSLKQTYKRCPVFSWQRISAKVSLQSTRLLPPHLLWQQATRRSWRGE